MSPGWRREQGGGRTAQPSVSVAQPVWGRLRGGGGLRHAPEHVRACRTAGWGRGRGRLPLACPCHLLLEVLPSNCHPGAPGALAHDPGQALLSGRWLHRACIYGPSISDARDHFLHVPSTEGRNPVGISTYRGIRNPICQMATLRHTKDKRRTWDGPVNWKQNHGWKTSDSSELGVHTQALPFFPGQRERGRMASRYSPRNLPP